MSPTAATWGVLLSLGTMGAMGKPDKPSEICGKEGFHLQGNYTCEFGGPAVAVSKSG